MNWPGPIYLAPGDGLAIDGIAPFKAGESETFHGTQDVIDYLENSVERVVKVYPPCFCLFGGLVCCKECHDKHEAGRP